MTAKLLPLLLTALILACPLNCMQENVESTESGVSACCSHCQSESNSDPLIPQPASDCCQCLCTGAIFENTNIIDLTLLSLLWGEPSFQDANFQLISLSQQSGEVSVEPDRLSGREIRCLQMTFQC
ncbi:hypothetical protein [Gimesia aquarii]|uniref:Uncharacterized protein n=1 Tax=Gimesia aquarii TaxID=2527964 RepID=A0A517VW60_9PLAN|nr:hypothetical protein [Gimesia aquarii]QDT97242.1 hypothetical protein V144x_27140 [Gimesia aquarii]